MTCWLVNTGTREDLFGPGDDIRRRYSEWNREHGPVQMFPRTIGIERGDVLIHRAVGSTASRLLAVGVVTSARPSASPRKPAAGPRSSSPERVERRSLDGEGGVRR